jgi:hypothetical protein
MLKDKVCSCKVWKIVLIVWLVFTTLYLVYGEYSRLQNFVANRAYNKGLADAVGQIITESQKCQAIPINVDDKKATLINVDCLKQPAAEEKAE